MKKRCVICSRCYVYVERGTNKGACQSNSCRAKLYFRNHRVKQIERYRQEYIYRKKHDHKKLRDWNQKAVSRMRFGVDSREEILERFGNKCANCKSTKSLVIHHIDNQGRRVKAPNNARKNLVVLCRSCHFQHHLGRL